MSVKILSKNIEQPQQNGKVHRGNWLEKRTAMDWVEYGNRKYPHIQHYLEVNTLGQGRVAWYYL